MRTGLSKWNLKLCVLGLLLASHAAHAFMHNAAFFRARFNSLQYSTNAQSIYSGNCSGIVTVKTYNPSGTLTNVSSNLTVNLSGPGTTTFYSDSGCTTPITAVTINSGSNSASFYFIDTATSSITITAAATSYTSANQNETLGANPFVWVGLGGNANWNTAANWSGGAVPGSGNPVLFNGTCTSNCSPIINTSVNVDRIRINSNFSGTITQNSGQTITTTGGGWIQAAGTFNGSDANISITGPMTISGGTFTSTSATLNVYTNFTVSGGGVYNHNNGMFTTNASYGSFPLTPGSAVFNNVTFTGYATGASITGTMSINGNLTCSDTHGGAGTINGGTINLQGNLTLAGGGWNNGGSGTIRMVGSGTQTISMAATSNLLPALEVASTGTVVFSGQVNTRNGYTYTSGTLTTTGSTFRVYCSNTCTATPGTVTYNNVELFTNAGTIVIPAGSTFKVGGNLATQDFYGIGYGNINTGTVEVSGNYSSTSFAGGTGLVRLIGTGTVTTTGGTPNVEINTTGTITLSGTDNFSNNFTYTAGTVVTTGSTVNFNNGNTATISAGSIVFNNVGFTGYNTFTTVSGTLNVGGNLTISEGSFSSLNGGTIAVQGNVSATPLSAGGTAALSFTGTGTQTFTLSSGSLTSGDWTINKPSGNLTLGSAITLTSATQNVNVISGGIDMAGYAFSIKNLSLNGNTLTKNAGVLTVNGTVQGTGSLFGGTVNP